MKTWITYEEANKLFKIPRTTFFRKLREGKIKRKKVGVLYNLKDLIKLKEEK